jgi:hypothetical protein
LGILILPPNILPGITGRGFRRPGSPDFRRQGIFRSIHITIPFVAGRLYYRPPNFRFSHAAAPFPYQVAAPFRAVLVIRKVARIGKVVPIFFPVVVDLFLGDSGVPGTSRNTDDAVL